MTQKEGDVFLPSSHYVVGVLNACFDLSYMLLGEGVRRWVRGTTSTEVGGRD